MESHSTRIGGLKVYYRTAGSPRSPVVIFLHAWGVRLGRTRQLLGLGFDRVLTELSRNYYVVAPEHPGLIRSEAPKELWTYKDYAKFLHVLTTQLGITDVVLVGSSFGGGIATAFADLFPDEVRSLILVHSVLPRDLQDKASATYTPYVGLLSRRLPLLLKRIIVASVCESPISFINAANLNREIQFIEREQDCMLDVGRPKVKSPVIIIYASDDHKIHPTRMAKLWNIRWPNSKLFLLKGSGPSFLHKNPYGCVDIINQETK